MYKLAFKIRTVYASILYIYDKLDDIILMFKVLILSEIFASTINSIPCDERIAGAYLVHDN